MKFELLAYWRGCCSCDMKQSPLNYNVVLGKGIKPTPNNKKYSFSPYVNNLAKNIRKSISNFKDYQALRKEKIRNMDMKMKIMKDKQIYEKII